MECPQGKSLQNKQQNGKTKNQTLAFFRFCFSKCWQNRIVGLKEVHCIVARRGTPSECLLLAGGFSAGRSDLRLLSGDAFSVCNCNYLSFCWGVCSNFVRLLHPPLFCLISEFGSSIIPRVCNSHCRKATKCRIFQLWELQIPKFIKSRIRKFGLTVEGFGSKRTRNVRRGQRQIRLILGNIKKDANGQPEACTSYDADMRDASYIASFMQKYKKRCYL